MTQFLCLPGVQTFIPFSTSCLQFCSKHCKTTFLFQGICSSVRSIGRNKSYPQAKLEVGYSKKTQEVNWGWKKVFLCVSFEALWIGWMVRNRLEKTMKSFLLSYSPDRMSKIGTYSNLKIISNRNIFKYKMISRCFVGL